MVHKIIINKKNISVQKIPKTIHFWEIDGFIKLSDKARKTLKVIIKKYGVIKLARSLNFDSETVFSIYTNGRKKGSHSISHIVKIATILDINLEKLEKNITSYGRVQTNMYNFIFPFVITPLHLRAVSIHGDGCFNKLTRQCSWYQKHDRILNMEKLLQLILKEKTISAYTKDQKISSITIPSSLVYLVCRSLNIELKEFDSIKFFENVCKLSKVFQFQVFLQFIIDEGSFKDTTLTVSQWKPTTRRGFVMLLDNLKIEHSNPKNNKDDITIYGFNYSKILNHLNKAIDRYGYLAGFWFKEEEFREICENINEKLSKAIVKSGKINKKIFKKLEKEKTIFSYQDIREFGRTSGEVNKAIRCWKKNGLIKRTGWNKYKIL